MTSRTAVAMRRYAFFLLAGLALVFSACDKDDDKEIVTTATISGSIHIDNADVWAEYVDSGELQVTIFPAFSLDPPAGWGTVEDEFFGPGAPGGTFAIGAPSNSQNPLVLTYVAGQTDYPYEIELDPGTYSALAVGFRHDLVTDPSLRTATIGVHWGTPQTVSHGIWIKVPGQNGFMTIFNENPPAEFTVQAGDVLAFNIATDFSFVKRWFR